MKTVVTPNGIPLPAKADAPAVAVCPFCGGTVALRKRRAMDGSLTYFWRHSDNNHLHCQERSSPTHHTKSL